jgi:hypothetical protein
MMLSLEWSNKFNEKDHKREDISLFRSLLFVELRKYNKAKEALGQQRPTIIKEIIHASKILNTKIDLELKRLQKIKSNKEVLKNKGVRSVTFKN